jgi:hypothetical protein
MGMRLLNSMRQGNNPRVTVIVQGSVSKSQLQEPFTSGVRCQRIASLQTVLLFRIPGPRSRFRLFSVQRTCCRLGLRLAERVEGLKSWSHLDQKESVGRSAPIPISELFLFLNYSTGYKLRMQHNLGSQKMVA